MSEIKNAKITKADLSMEDHGVLTLSLAVEGAGGGVCLGGYVLGKGYLGAKSFEGSAKGIEEIMRVMDTVGVERFSDLTGRYIRVEIGNLGNRIKKFGNIVEDKWFDYADFYKD